MEDVRIKTEEVTSLHSPNFCGFQLNPKPHLIQQGVLIYFIRKKKCMCGPKSGNFYITGLENIFGLKLS